MDYLALQTLDGRVVHVNPAAIVTIGRTSDDPSKKLVTEKVHCIVTLVDGKFITVVERCDAIRKRLENP